MPADTSTYTPTLVDRGDEGGMFMLLFLCQAQ